MKILHIKWILMMMLVLGLTSPVLSATVYYVNGAAASSGDGTSWNSAYTKIQDGINAASNAGGGDVWVAKGSYYIYSSSSSDTVILKDNVNVYGGFSGSETSLDQRDVTNNVTILDGHSSSGSQNQVAHVLTASEVDNVTFDGFTVTGGNSQMTGPPAKRIAQARATSPDEIFSTNGGGSGGGMLIWRCDPTVKNCIFTYNSANKGGGVYVMVATEFPSTSPNPAPTFTDCTFSYNTVSARGAGQMNDVASHPTFTRCKFINNTCEAKGGGMYNDFGCSPTIINCLFADNTAQQASAMGNDGSSSPLLVNCTVTNNYAYDVGAGLYTGSYLGTANEPTLVNCIVWGNNNQWGGPRDLNVWHENHFYISYSFIGNGFTSKGTGVIQDAAYTQNPLFVDSANGDYRLQAGSPCINTGTASDTNVPDNDLNSSIRDASPDMGAYEYEYTDTPVTTGSLQVTILPQAAIDAGAMWKLDDNDWQASGTTLRTLNAGEYTVTFQKVDGYTSPSDQVITIISGQTTTITATYSAENSETDTDTGTDTGTGNGTTNTNTDTGSDNGGGGCFIKIIDCD